MQFVKMTRHGRHCNHYDNFQFKKYKLLRFLKQLEKKKKLFIDIDKGINSFNLCLSTWIFWSFNKGWSKANCLLISMQSTICPNSVYKFKKEKISSIIAWKQVLQHVIYEIKKKKTIIIISLPWFRQCLKNMMIVSCDREDR